MSVQRQTTTTWHLVLTARPGLEPFAPGPGQTAAIEALHATAARGQAVVIAFCVLPGELDLLVAGDDPTAVSGALRTAITRRVNRALGRQGTLLGDSPRMVGLPPDQDWSDLAEAIEQRAAAQGLALTACSGAVDYTSWVRTASPPAAPSRGQEPPPQTVGEVIRVAEVATVVQLSAAVALGDALELEPAQRPGELTSYVGEWFLVEPRTRATVRTVLGALARPMPGGGFFVAGLYGAGKSHLLAVVSLVARLPAARRELIASHPELADLAPGLSQVGPRLVVAVALDEQSPARAL
ncbi:MAG: hypothetical protein HUU35_00930, partial [Armatimonadetes bacterium]|nr:hypothetical protein [Armatimonadota bacterium]